MPAKLIRVLIFTQTLIKFLNCAVKKYLQGGNFWDSYIFLAHTSSVKNVPLYLQHKKIVKITNKYSQCGFETIFLTVQNIPCFKFDYFGWIICLYPLSDTTKCETSIENFEQLIQHQETDHKMCKICKVGKWSLENAERVNQRVH